MAICMDGLSNWRGVERSMSFLLGHHAGRVFADFDLLKVMSLDHIVRARHGSERFGRHGLTEEELKLVCNDNLLWMRTLWLAVQAYEANKNLEITLEQPQDPEQWKQPPSDVFQASWHGQKQR